MQGQSYIVCATKQRCGVQARNQKWRQHSWRGKHRFLSSSLNLSASLGEIPQARHPPDCFPQRKSGFHIVQAGNKRECHGVNNYRLRMLA